MLNLEEFDFSKHEIDKIKNIKNRTNRVPPKNKSMFHFGSGKMLPGETLQKIRLAHNMTRNDVSKLMGIGPSNIAQYEWGINPIPNKRAEQLKEIFGVSFL